jgi:hypothetical protein
MVQVIYNSLEDIQILVVLVLTHGAQHVARVLPGGTFLREYIVAEQWERSLSTATNVEV